MSTRQNKKQRKNRNNASNRERTVTTLTGDPNTPYLNPPVIEKASMSTSFSGGNAGTGGGKVHTLSMGPQAYQMQNSFGYGYPQSFGPIQNMHQQQFQPRQQQQEQFYPPSSQQTSQMLSDVPLPPGKSDLEILQNLKKMILDNQHPFYKAIPSPAYLASLWKGTVPPHSQQAAQGSEQTISEYRGQSNDEQRSPPSSAGFNGERRQSRNQTRDRRLSAAANQQNNSGQGDRYNAAPAGHNVSNLDLAGLNISKDSHVSLSAAPSLESRLSDVPAPPTGSGAPQDLSDSQRQGRYDYSARSRSRDDYASRNVRPVASDYDNAAMDVSMSGESSAYNAKDEMARSGGWLPRDAAGPRPDRGYDSERAITPRPQVSGGPTNESRSLGPLGRGAGPLADDRDTDRPHKEGWHVYDTQHEYERPGDAKPMHGISGEHGQAPARSAPSEAPLSIDARRASEVPPPAGDIRPPVVSRPPPDARAPARTAERIPAENNEDIGSSRSSSVRPPEAPVPPSLGSVPSAAPANDLVIEPPSLKDRLNIPPSLPSRRENEAPPAADEQQHQHPPASHGRSGKPQKFQKDRGSGYNGGPPSYDAPHRGGDRGYHRPPTPPGPPFVSGGGSGPPHRNFDSRSASVDRTRVPPSGSPASRGAPPSREYRGPPGRDMSRPIGQSYRPDYHDDPRYDPRYEGRPYRDYSPPPAPLPLTSARGGPPGIEPPPSGRADYYPPRGRGWEEEDYYKSRGWDGPPPSERGRYERDYPPPRSASWDSRDREYDPRDTYPPGPSGPSYDDRYVPGPPADRGRLPPAGYNASYSRVRPRSPSPIRRGPAPPDDSRPPLKRAREDYPPDYYTPSSGGRRPSDYPGPPPRSGSPGPPPSSSGWGGPPPPPPPTTGSSASSMGVGPHSHPSSGDRDYRMGREPPMDYGPPPGEYDRPRSPGPPGPPGGSGRMPYNRGGGSGYGRGGEPRDRGGYGVPRP